MCLAWETAANSSEYDFYLWLNDDTILFPESIYSLVNQSIKLDNKKIIVGTTCSRLDGSFTYGGYKFHSKKVIPDGTWQDCDFFNGNIVLAYHPTFLTKWAF